MKKFIKSRLLLQIVIASLVATFATAGIVAAATTIGANIVTTGTLSVTGASTLSDDVTIAAGKGLILGSAPSDLTATQGMIYYDSGNDVIRMSDGTNWHTLGTSTSGITLSSDKLQLSDLEYYMTIGTTTQTGLSILTLAASSTTAIPLTIRGILSHAANLMQIQDNVGTTLFSVNQSGNVSIDGGTFIFNESSADVDFRAESNGQAYMFFIDAAVDKLFIATSTIGSAQDSVLTVMEGLSIFDDTTPYDQLFHLIDSGDDALLMMYEDNSQTIQLAAAAGTISYIGGNTIGLGTTTPSATYAVDIDGDVRIGEEGAGNQPYAFLVNAGSGFVSIGTSTNTIALTIEGDLRIGESGSADALTVNGGSMAIVMGGALTVAGNAILSGTLDVTGNVEFDGGSFIFNESTADVDFRIESDDNDYMFFVDGGSNQIGIGTSTITATVDIYSTGTTTLSIDTNDATKGGCFMMKDSVGTQYYGTLTTGTLGWTTTASDCGL